MKVMTNLDSILKSRDITLPTKVHLVEAMVFSSSHAWMWELDHTEVWVLKNWCFQIVLLEKTLESLLDWKKINPKGHQPWIFIGRTDAKAIRWPKYWSFLMRANSLEKTLMLGKIEGRRRREQQRTDGWMASVTQWTWVWASSRRWWKTGMPGVLQSMKLQRARHDRATQQQQQQH